jgi:hypothetical protein
MFNPSNPNYVSPGTWLLLVAVVAGIVIVALFASH